MNFDQVFLSIINYVNLFKVYLNIRPAQSGEKVHLIKQTTIDNSNLNQL